MPTALCFGFFSVFCDVLDGTLARKFQMQTQFGLVFDSIADRTSELAVVIGALAGGIVLPIGIFAIVGSTALFLFRGISYRRGCGTDYVMFGRVERLLFIFLGLVSPLVGLSTFFFVVAGAFGLVSSVQIAVNMLRGLPKPQQRPESSSLKF
jgi:phosphatidylglycerophosphate synthase